MRSALSAKLADNEIVLVKPFDFDEPSTKAAVAVLKALGLDNERVTLVISNEDVVTYLSFRNIPTVDILPVNNINTYELLDNKKLLIVDECLTYIEEVLA
jgi:large subunit ribosomal protein L4